MDLSFSWMALHRILLNQLSEDPALRRELKRARRPMLPEVRGLSDERILEKLRSLGVDVTRDWLREQTRHHWSAQSIAEPIIERPDFNLDRFQDEWLWMGILVLWERWFPDVVSMEWIDQAMQHGYSLDDDHEDERLLIWGGAWQAILEMMDEWGIGSLREFDLAFGGMQSARNWIRDLETEYLSASLGDARHCPAHRLFCQTWLERFSEECEQTVGNIRRCLAHTHFIEGDHATGDRLYRQWLDEDSTWGWGWIGWADMYAMFADEPDPDRAIGILREGLSVTGVTERDHMLERLERIGTDEAQKQAAGAVRAEFAESQAQPEETRRRLRVEPGDSNLVRTPATAREELPLIASFQNRSADEILELFSGIGLKVTREWLGDQLASSVSHGDIVRDLPQTQKFRVPEEFEFSVWQGIARLWELWFPDVPGMRMVEDLIEAGEEAQSPDERLGHWKNAWESILQIIDRVGLDSVEHLEAVYDGMYSVSEWLLDYEGQYHAVACRHEPHLSDHVALCENWLNRFAKSCEWTTSAMRRGLAEARCVAGEFDTADRLYREWLAANPAWGWGWIGWSRMQTSDSVPDGPRPDRALEILREGLNVADVDDRFELLAELTLLGQDYDRVSECESLRNETIVKFGDGSDQLSAWGTAGDIDDFDDFDSDVDVEVDEFGMHVRERVTFGEEGLPLDEWAEFHKARREAQDSTFEPIEPLTSARKVGRNEPCPCGSGKKYKKCCGR